MAGLRDLLQYSSSAAVPNGVQRILRVYDTAVTTANNGGSVCDWTVPEGVTWAGIEMWAGGGGGGFACCNFSGRGGYASAYGRAIINLTPGDVWKICAGGTTVESNSIAGVAGNPSFMCKADTICYCIAGGAAQGTCCGFKNSRCDWGRQAPICNTASDNFTYVFPAVESVANNGAMGACFFYSMRSGSPYAHPGTQSSLNGCAWNCGNSHGGRAAFPGSGGASANACSTCYNGGFGAGGLVQVIYYDTPPST